MTKDTLRDGTETPIESEQRRLGRRLVLEFVSGGIAELNSIAFKYNHESLEVRLERGGSDQGMSFAWTAVPQAVAILFLDYLCWDELERKKKGEVRRRKIFTFPQNPNERRLAASIGYDRYNEDGSVRKLFTQPINTGGVLEHVHEAVKVVLSLKSTRPRAIQIKPGFLPADCIEVYWGERGKLVGLKDLVDLRNQIGVPLGLKALEQPIEPKVSPQRGTAFDQDNYANAIRNRYGRVPLEILDATAGFNQELPFFQLFVPQNVIRCQEYLAPALEERFGRLQRRGDIDFLETVRRKLYGPVPQNVLEVVQDPDYLRLVVLGSVGAGKSSLLQFLALRWAEARPSNRNRFRVPLLIELQLYVKYAEARRRGGNNYDFNDFLKSGTGTFWRFPAETLKTWFVKGHATVLLDGLDEILDDQKREEVITQIVRFATEYPLVQVVLTSRIIGYKGDALYGAKFTHFALLDFDDEQIERFIDNWNVRINGTRKIAHANDKADILKQAISDSRELNELAGSPFFLTMMILLNECEGLPNDREDLIRKYSRLLLERWKVTEALREDPDLASDATALGFREKLTILRHVARYMSTTEPQTNLISVVALENIIASLIKGLVRANPLSVTRAMIRHLRERAGMLCLIKEDQYGFVHRAFFEFFSADDVHQRFAAGLIGEREVISWFLKIWRDDNCNDIPNFYCRMARPSLVASLLSLIIDNFGEDNRSVLSVANCLARTKRHKEYIPLSRPVTKRLVAMSICSALNPEPCKKISKARRGVRSKSSSWVKFARESNHLFREENAQQAVVLLARLSDGNVDILKHLQHLVDSADYPSVGSKSVEAVAEGWTEHPRIREWLENIAQSSHYAEVRSSALLELAGHWRSDMRTLAFLKQRLSVDPDEHIRQTAVLTIADGWKQNKTVFRWLKQQVKVNKDSDVRVAAARGIARNYHDRKEMLLWLKRIVATGKDDSVRKALVEEIADNWNYGSHLLNWLKSLARSDEDPYVRQEAVTALCKGWSHNTAVNTLFKCISESDEDEDTRRAAFAGLRHARMA